jgi:hypothetical protein
MSDQPEKTLRIHVGLFLAEIICVPAFIWQLSRALTGNLLSWAYVFEWPILGGYAIFMWRRLLQEERGQRVRPQIDMAKAEADDPELAAWNAYLAKVHGIDEGDDKRDA